MQNETAPDNDLDNPDQTPLEGSVSDPAPAVTEELGPLEAQRERYLRLAAEFDNYRKRTAKEAQQAQARGQGELIKMLLDSVDDVSRFAHVDPTVTDSATLVKGVEMVEKNISKILTSVGVEVIDPVELPFDPNLHEAVSTQAAETPEEDHMVAQVYQRGYMLNGQLLRPARVVVKQYQ
jgi:molecular chaperone GrpE